MTAYIADNSKYKLSVMDEHGNYLTINTFETKKEATAFVKEAKAIQNEYPEMRLTAFYGNPKYKIEAI